MTDAPSSGTTSGRDYRETVFLPETEFPMRAGLPKAEPVHLENWANKDLYAHLRRLRQAAGAPRFVLHDGPPYANGNIHIGHALNKLLKDFVVRSRFMLGFDVDYVPGWDCHGLPIEWKIEEEFRAKGRRKDEVSKEEFRKRCREYAADWIEKQKTEFKRLGGLANWDGRYATMDFATEAKIVKEFMTFKNTGQLYRGSKPVMWSPVERTALAEAEVEYHPHVSPTVWVRFSVVDGAESIDGADVVIWTTTPWTIPANRAVSFNPEIAYGVYEVKAMETGLAFDPWAKPGDRLIVADKLAEDVRGAAKIAEWVRVEDAQMEGAELAHPLRDLDAGYGFSVPMLSGDHVTDDAGTGFVHTAPGHGADDFEVWKAHGHHEIPDTVDADGAYYAHVPLFAGLKVLETEGKKAGKFGPANDEVMKKLIEAGKLLARGRLEHSYPHSWRSKAPIIFRNTPQWFVRMDKPLTSQNLGFVRMDKEIGSLEGQTLRDVALGAIEDTKFYPDAGKNRIRAMVEGRPDWLISRQRAWGTPLAMYVDKQTGQPLHDDAVDARILAAIEAEGADAWFTRPDSDFLGTAYDASKYEKVEDILDVWFDSGSTHAFTIEGRADAHWPADLYLEGSDQHRGWFQSSLLEGCGTRGRAPYKAVLTHGFTLDENGEKMSKSKGNTIAPQDVIKESGADILRLWTAMVDYSDDQRIGKQILQTTADAYRKIRNTLRYLLGGLKGFSDAEKVAYADMPSLEHYVLHRLAEIDAEVKTAYESYRFMDALRPVAEFCTGVLSSLYFDVRKDVLYCDAPSSLRRRACRTVMDLVFERLTAWLSPILSFTTEEAWALRHPDADLNATRTFPVTPAEWKNAAVADKWQKIQTVLEVVNSALEIERREKRIGSALEAAPKVYVADEALLAAYDGIDAAEVFRTSQATLVKGEAPTGAFTLEGIAGVGVEPLKAEGNKCARSWRILPEVGTDPRYPDLSLRDAEAVAAFDAA